MKSPKLNTEQGVAGAGLMKSTGGLWKLEMDVWTRLPEPDRGSEFCDWLEQVLDSVDIIDLMTDNFGTLYTLFDDTHMYTFRAGCGSTVSPGHPKEPTAPAGAACPLSPHQSTTLKSLACINILPV
jgi:hypothetical protein